MRLQGNAALVTGGGPGIGEAVARKFAREGASVMAPTCPTCPSRTPSTASSRPAERRPRSWATCPTRSRRGGASRRPSRPSADWDVLVGNAGVFPEHDEVVDADVATFDYLLRMGIRTAFLMAKFAAPEVRKARGSIVFTGSLGGIEGVPHIAAHTGIKGFIHRFMEGVALEEAKHGVRVNAVAPGSITSAWSTSGAGGPLSAEMVQACRDVCSWDEPARRRRSPTSSASSHRTRRVT